MDRINQRLAIVAGIPPAAAATTATSTSDVVDMSKFKRVMFVLHTGSMAAASTIDMEIQEGVSTTSFNTATALADMTQLINTDDNKYAVLEVSDEDMTEGYRYLRAIVTQGGGATIYSLEALAADPNYHPASDNDLAAVKQIENA